MIYEIVKHAKNHHSIDSILLGSKRSFAVKRLYEDGVNFTFIDDSKKIDFQDDPSDLFIHFHNFDGFHKIKKLKGQSIIWGILAPQITDWNRFGIEKRLFGKKLMGNYLTQRMISYMHSKNALISMDGATSDAIDSFCGKRLHLPIIPIPVDTIDARSAKISSNFENRVLEISYIGRSDDIWKIKPLKKVIKDLQTVNNQVFQINIYTDSAKPYIEELQNVLSGNVTLQFYTGYYGPVLRDHISTNSDLHFSMGTAAIEGALAGIPTILVDPCLSDLPNNYRYKWLSETERCSLGRFVSRDDENFSGLTIKEILEIIRNPSNYFEIAESCLNYVKNNHGVDSVLRKIIHHPTTATNKDVAKFTPASWHITKLFTSFILGK